jgi:hypothetical protein
MKAIAACNPYHAKIVGRELLRGGDGKSVFKVYFVDIVGRAEPSRTEWAQAGLDRASYLAQLAALPGVEGVGFVTAFAHITKVFRWGPEAETVANVRAWHTRGLTDLALGRSDSYLEFACLAEAALAADEFQFWARAATVAEYLAQWSAYADGPIASHTKLAAYWQ